MMYPKIVSRLGADPGFSKGAWRERRKSLYNVGLRQSPQQDPGSEPLVGDRGLVAESFVYIFIQK